MAKRNDARYAPGELDRVRTNLGPLTQEESSRMAEILGGDIGRESWDPAVEAGYARLRSRAYARAPAPSTRPASPTVQNEEDERFPDIGRALGPVSGPPATTAVAGSVTPYSERVRMDLIASRPQHAIKTRRAAIASFLSFLVDVPDFVNPRFVLDFDAEIGNHVDTLVLAVRTIADKSKKQVYHSLRKDPLSFRILNVIREWNIESMHRELTYLQGRPRRLPVADCDDLVRHLYGPIMRLQDLEPLFHVSRAVQFAYQQHVQSLPKSSPHIDRLRKNLMVAQQEIGAIFSGLKRRCYPLLMKLTSTRCLDQSEFFNEEREPILQFLGIQESELLRARIQEQTPILDSLPEEEPADADDTADGVDDIESADDEEPAVPEVAGPVEGRRIYGAVYKGLLLLEKLFPDAGWLKLDTHPDLYAYFQPLLSLPRGYELLPPADVLTPVVTLVAILRDLFYSYRDIKFGALRDEDGQQLNLAEIMEELLDSWHRYLDDVVGSEYIPRIVEYCRHIERHPDFRSSRYAKRLEAEMAWIKAKHLTRWSRLLSASGLRIPTSKALPPLYERVDELKEFLTRVALDIDSARKEQATCGTIVNPWAEPVFPVQSTISRRFTAVLGKPKPATNADVVYATVSMLYVLGYLLEDETNPYAAVDTALAPYRGVDGRGGEPAYVVDLRPTQDILSAFEADEASQHTDVAAMVNRDEVTGLRNTVSLREELRAAIKRYDEDKVQFVVVGASIKGLDAYRSSMGEDRTNTLLEQFADCVTEAVDQSRSPAFRLDDDEFLIVLPEADAARGVETAKALYKAGLRRDPSNLQLSLAVVPFYRTWGPERLLKSAGRAIALAGGHPYPICLVYKSARNSYEILDLLDDAEPE